jgi:WD40 repeat protein
MLIVLILLPLPRLLPHLLYSKPERCSLVTRKLMEERFLGGNAARANKLRKHEVMERVHQSISMKGSGYGIVCSLTLPLLCYSVSLMTTPSTMTGAYWGNGVAFTLTVGQEGSPLIEINDGNDIRAVAFATNCEYLVSGGTGPARIRVWRVEDGKQMATMEAQHVWCLAVSEDRRWIAAGTWNGKVFVWDAKTYEKIFSHRADDRTINGVDFSPDSTRLVSASHNMRASIWELATRTRVQTLGHQYSVTTAKYSPRGDRIATATHDSVRVWDSNNGRLLVTSIR